MLASTMGRHHPAAPSWTDGADDKYADGPLCLADVEDLALLPAVLLSPASPSCCRFDWFTAYSIVCYCICVRVATTAAVSHYRTKGEEDELEKI